VARSSLPDAPADQIKCPDRVNGGGCCPEQQSQPYPSEPTTFHSESIISCVPIADICRAEGTANDDEACLHDVAPLVGRLPLGEEPAIVKLKARRLLSDVNVDSSSTMSRTPVLSRRPSRRLVMDTPWRR